MPRTARSLAPALAAALAAVLGACVPRTPPPDLSLDPPALLAQVYGASGIVSHVQGEARLHVEAPGQKGTAPAFVAVERPDRLHVEVLDFFGNPSAVLVTSGGQLAIYDRRARTFYRGKATAANVARLVPLPLAPERLVGLLLGAPPLDGVPAPVLPGGGYVTLQLNDPPRATVVRVGPHAVIERVTYMGEPGVPDYEVRYRSFLDLPAGRLPTEVEISAESAGVRIELAWKEGDLTVPVAASLFRMEPPAGARVVDLDAAPEPLPGLPLSPASPAP
jgi:hypothetical protein